MTQHTDDSHEALARYLDTDPARSVRDFKGKGFDRFNPFDRLAAAPGEVPFDKLNRDEVRRLATSEHARFLPRNVRRAAARDPSLGWDERRRSYFLRADGAPHPPLAGDGHGEAPPV